MIGRGAVCWAGTGPDRRAVLVVQSDALNRTRRPTVLAVGLVANTALATLPGNVFLAAGASGLPAHAVADLASVTSVDRAALDPVGQVPAFLMRKVDEGLRRVLAL